MRWPGFYRLSLSERRRRVEELFGPLELSLSPEQADKISENVVGVIGLPFSVATNFRLNQRDFLVPMAVEEPSVVAAASHGAKLTLPEGFRASASEQVALGQIFLKEGRPELLGDLEEVVNQEIPRMVERGGGYRGLRIRFLEEGIYSLDVYVDVRDAQGANTVNRVVEALIPEVESRTGGEVVGSIVSNLPDRRLAWAKAEFSIPEDLGRKVCLLNHIAEVDDFRRATHVKGIANGIGALALATGNDWRAVLAGLFAWAFSRRTSLTTYRWEKGKLVGEFLAPLQLATVGGTVKALPHARTALKLLGVKTARELNSVAAALGLAQNLAALRAITLEGISKGHMRLHARQVALSVGAQGEEVESVAEELTRRGDFSPNTAREILAELRGKRGRGRSR